MKKCAERHNERSSLVLNTARGKYDTRYRISTTVTLCYIPLNALATCWVAGMYNSGRPVQHSAQISHLMGRKVGKQFFPGDSRTQMSIMLPCQIRKTWQICTHLFVSAFKSLFSHNVHVWLVKAFFKAWLKVSLHKSIITSKWLIAVKLAWDEIQQWAAYIYHVGVYVYWVWLGWS